MSLAPAQSLLVILVVTAVTVLTRVLPFLLFPEGKRTPAIVLRLGKLLPPALMAMLVIYCLKAVNVTAFPFGLPEFISVAAVLLLHKWKHNTILSVGAGTVLYMLLVQFVFV